MRKVAYVVSSIILTACGGGGSNPAPTTNNAPVTQAAVVSKDYFQEVAGAFPDPTLTYWFFDPAHASAPLDLSGKNYPAKVAGSIAVDLNNDGKLEFLMTFHKGKGSDLLWRSYVAEPCKSLTVIYELNSEGKFVDASEKYIEGTRDSQSCSGFIYSILDINGDGLKDIFYSTNQSDGRSNDAGSLVTGYVVAYVSQPNKKYKMHRTGEGKYYGSIGHGVDYYGKQFVTAAGFPSDLGVYRQNHKYMWNGVSLHTVHDGILPGISPVTFNFYSTDNKSSNRMVQQTFFRGHYGVEGYYMENGSWFPTNHVNPEMKLIASGQSIINYAGDRKPVDVYEYKGKHVLAGTMGGVENLCTVRMGNSEPFSVGVTYMPTLKTLYASGTELKFENLNFDVELTAYTIKGKELIRTALNIPGETNLTGGRLQCIDVNKDGYDDLVMSVGPGKTNEISRIYINQKDSTFKKLDIGDLSKFVLHDVDKHMSEMADFDGDGIMDIIVYPDNVLNNKSLKGAIKFYKGVKTVQ
jgi:hypothetical protein